MVWRLNYSIGSTIPSPSGHTHHHHLLHSQPSPGSSAGAASTHPIYTSYLPHASDILDAPDTAIDMTNLNAAAAAEWNIYHQPTSVGHHHAHATATMYHSHHQHPSAGHFQPYQMGAGGSNIYLDRTKSGKKAKGSSPRQQQQQQQQLRLQASGGAGYWTEKPSKRSGGGGGGLHQHQNLHRSGGDLMRAGGGGSEIDMMVEIVQTSGDDQLPVSYLARYHQQRQQLDQQQDDVHVANVDPRGGLNQQQLRQMQRR